MRAGGFPFAQRLEMRARGRAGCAPASDPCAWCASAGTNPPSAGCRPRVRWSRPWSRETARSRMPRSAVRSPTTRSDSPYIGEESTTLPPSATSCRSTSFSSAHRRVVGSDVEGLPGAEARPPAAARRCAESGASAFPQVRRPQSGPVQASQAGRPCRRSASARGAAGSGVRYSCWSIDDYHNRINYCRGWLFAVSLTGYNRCSFHFATDS